MRSTSTQHCPRDTPLAVPAGLPLSDTMLARDRGDEVYKPCIVRHSDLQLQVYLADPPSVVHINQQWPRSLSSSPLCSLRFFMPPPQTLPRCFRPRSMPLIVRVPLVPTETSSLRRSTPSQFSRCAPTSLRIVIVLSADMLSRYSVLRDWITPSHVVVETSTSKPPRCPSLRLCWAFIKTTFNFVRARRQKWRSTPS